VASSLSIQQSPEHRISSIAPNNVRCVPGFVRMRRDDCNGQARSIPAGIAGRTRRDRAAPSRAPGPSHSSCRRIVRTAVQRS